MKKAICFGEVLWDVFLDSKRIGGAPLNVALRLKSLGFESSIISKIGDDNDGIEILKYIQKSDIPVKNIQKDDLLFTGKVDVILDTNGIATYDIVYPVAFDKIEFSKNTNNDVLTTNVFVFGSLIARDSTSYKTLLSYIEVATFKVFDVNLRAPHYNYEVLLKLMNLADFIKFNDEELDEICAHFSLNNSSLETQVLAISKLTDTHQICVTLGDKGAVLCKKNEFFYNNGVKVKVADTVGAGDSFLAGLLSQLLLGKSPQESLNFGCAIGALVASKKGANAVVNQSEIAKILDS